MRRLFLSIAAMLILSSCGSFNQRPLPPMTRSEMVCDRSPPEPIPEIPSTHPELEAAHRTLISLYHAEIIKYIAEMRCRQKVRAENAQVLAP